LSIIELYIFNGGCQAIELRKTKLSYKKAVKFKNTCMRLLKL